MTHADPLTSDSTVQTDLERFMWNYLAWSTGAETEKKCSRGNASLACGAGEQCVGYKSTENGAPVAGACINSSVWYVASYSTALECVGCNGNATVNEFRWKVTDAAQMWEEMYGWPNDPVWTESNWPLGVPQLVMYLREPPARAQRVLLAGMFITGFTLIIVVTLRYAWLKRLKQD
jgi:nicastrin